MNNSLHQNIPHLQNLLSEFQPDKFLKKLSTDYDGSIVFSSSFSYEDQVITHLIADQHLPIQIFTLDTGRLFAETYSVWNSTLERYKISIKAFYPDQFKLESFVEKNGPNAFYESVENRKDCCYIRKVEPLKRALTGNAIWVTGLRAEHSAARQDLQSIEWDESNQIIKYHPLLHWTTEQVSDFIRTNNIPYNPLHDKGFVSIGCAPCTRAIKEGEDFRAGRWWWEDANKKECGLHVHQ
ncbi:MAG: phosphoadenylyl-sulfate reductase [Bacteroidota bacterium]